MSSAVAIIKEKFVLFDKDKNRLDSSNGSSMQNNTDYVNLCNLCLISKQMATWALIPMVNCWLKT